MSPEHIELQNYLERIQLLTEQGKIDWKRANPSTFTWTRRDGASRAKLTLQKVDRNVRIRTQAGQITTKNTRHYIFQVTEGQTAAQMLTVNTSEDEGFAEIMGKLFETIQAGISRKGLDFLKNILPE